MDEVEGQAAARIQAVQRGRLARFSADRRRRSLVRREATARWEREQAVIKIQAACRGTRGREETALYREQQAAASKIQARIRGDKARKDFNRKSPGGLPLDRADIKKGLHTLGRNPHDLRLCYIGLMAANAGVSNINSIVEFPLLQTVDLSGNCISSTKPLSRLPFLHDLDISHNCLTSLLDYELFEGEDFSWQASQDWLHDWRSEVVRSSSMLHRVNVSYNRRDPLRDLSHHRNLQHLDLSHNAIEVLEGLSALKCLRTLRMNNNKIRRIEGLEGLPLVELHLDHNYIEKAENVGSEKLASLRILRLGFNDIGNLSNLKTCLSLVTLDVRFNKVSAVRQVEYLQECQFLHTLVLEGNPMDRLEAYRARVIFRLQGLMLLDRNKISPEEKVKAVNLMGDEESDLPHRKQVFHKHLPGAEFTNTLPPFREPEGPPAPEPEPAEKPETVSGSDSPEEGGFVFEDSTVSIADPPAPTVVSREAISCVEHVMTASSYGFSSGALQ
ncbi:unnamed protein product [Ectocarpus sp. 8 AP-2014]